MADKPSLTQCVIELGTVPDEGQNLENWRPARREERADKPPLTQYLIELATVPEEAQRFRNCDPTRRETLMQEAGLNRPQRAAVQSGDAKQIVEQLMIELEQYASTSAKYKGSTLSIVLPMDHITLGLG